MSDDYPKCDKCSSRNRAGVTTYHYKDDTCPRKPEIEFLPLNSIPTVMWDTWVGLLGEE